MKAAALPMRGHRAIVHVTMDKIGKWNDGAVLKFRYAIGFKGRVKVRFDFGKAGYIAVEDVPVGCMCCKRNNEYPPMRTRNGTGIGRLQNRSVLLFFDDCRTAADDGRIGGDERDVDVLVWMKFLLESLGHQRPSRIVPAPGPRIPLVRRPRPW